MTTEHALQRRVVKLMRLAGGHVHKHVDAQPGVPDLSFSFVGVGDGWLELKVGNGALRPEQKLWLNARTRAGGRCWVLVQQGRQYALCDWSTARAVTYQRLEDVVQRLKKGDRP